MANLNNVFVRITNLNNAKLTYYSSLERREFTVKFNFEVVSLGLFLTLKFRVPANEFALKFKV